MSIFLGNSIYKGGSGGGGYKNGGELEDADFIKVENNTTSSYDNDSRNEINFYFEPKQGEILDSVIELETDVNATVNVYKVNNDVLVPLGNSGGNTVTGGEDYTVTVVGDSFAIEQVNAPSVDPDQLLVLDKYAHDIFLCQKINGLYWATKDHYQFVPFSHVQNIHGPFRVPTKNEYFDIKNNYAIEAVTMPGTWHSSTNKEPTPNPTNSTLLGFEGTGFKPSGSDTIDRKNIIGVWWHNIDFGSVNCFVIDIFVNQWDPNNVQWGNYNSSGYSNPNNKCNIRCIYDP
ncbi:MAG: hypothetical protein IKS59_03865 [Aeriscardovia sp.]|nr:hypothetical protein [Aeriscardovia sp.]